MPLRKKKNTNLTKYLIIAALIVVVALMLISFPATRNVTEIVLYP